MRQELRAAGVTDAALRRSYAACRRLNARHGKTYYLATLLLPPAKRPFVHALYGFARYADEIVDAPDAGAVRERRALLDDLRRRLENGLRQGRSDDPVIAAVVDTASRWGIQEAHFDAFLSSMAMDLTIGSYETFDDLNRYVYGSASVIGLQMLPILEPTDPEAAAAGATALGIAFQLANFIRDVGEDLDRGRIYLPLAELAEHGVTPRSLETRVVDDRLRAALASQIARVRTLSEQARPAVQLLHPAVRDCIESARVLYCGIADQVEAIDYEVFSTRARVPGHTRARVAFRGWRRARRARRIHGPGRIPPAGRPIGATPAGH